MTDSFIPVSIRKSTKDRIVKLCMREYMENHPEFKENNGKMTMDFIINRMIDYYL